MATRRRATPLRLQEGAQDGSSTAVVGGGVAGLECALALVRAGRDVTLFEAAPEPGGAVALAARAPARRGWQRIVDYYLAALGQAGVDVRLGLPAGDLSEFGEVVVATGAVETLPPLPGAERARRTSDVISRGIDGAERVVVVDDGFGWWPCVSAVEAALSAGADVTVLTPAGVFAGGIPAESRTQLQPRLAGRPLHARSFLTAVEVEDDALVARNRYSGERERIPADLVVFVGERVPAGAPPGLPPGARVQLVGDAVVPRRVAHAIAEGRAAAAAIAGV
jgi:2,4-dienoyl-CoA reductase (NADPH2)